MIKRNNWIYSVVHNIFFKRMKGVPVIKYGTILVDKLSNESNKTIFLTCTWGRVNRGMGQ